MRTNYILLIVFTTTTCFSQTAKDYFFPNSDKNVSEYKTPNFEFGTKVFFKGMGDSVMITTAFQHGNDFKIGEQNIVKLSDLEIEEVRIKTNEFSRVNYNGMKGTYYGANGKIVFKIPGDGKKVEWTNPESGSMQQSHVAEFCSVKVNGKKRKAVKVTTINRKKRSEKQQVFYIDYYVEGIGRYKRTSESGKIVEKLEDQKFETNLPTLK